MTDIERKGETSRRDFIKLSGVGLVTAGTGYFAWRYGVKLPVSIHGRSPDSNELKPITPEKMKNRSVDVLNFGPFWHYEDGENPAEIAAVSMENGNLVPGANYKEIPVDYVEALRLVKESAAKPGNLIVILAVGGSENITSIETSAGNGRPDPLPENGLPDPYSISVERKSIYPDEPIDNVRRMSPLLTGGIQEFIDDNEWQNVVLADNGVPENLSPCNAALYTLLKACEENGGKDCFLVHLPMNPEALPDATKKISALIEHLRDSSDS